MIIIKNKKKNRKEEKEEKKKKKKKKGKEKEEIIIIKKEKENVATGMGGLNGTGMCLKTEAAGSENEPSLGHLRNNSCHQLLRLVYICGLCRYPMIMTMIMQ